MISIEDQDLEVLKRHHHALNHLRERKASNQIALFFGAGASKPLGFPSWSQLIDLIESQPEFDNYEASTQSENLTYRTQALIQHLKQSHLKGSNIVDASSERVAKYEWLRLVHKCLYKNAKVHGEKILHPYLSNYLSVIKDSPLTINYNFDDCIERMLASEYRQEQTSNHEKVYETVWDSSTQYQRSKGVIYHPNGFLPKNLVEGYSDAIVFAETEFADQLIQTMHGHYSTLVSHLSRYTSLLIGLSLDDPTLKHLLRQNTSLNPGHAHYWIKYCSELPSESAMQEERDVNFEIYGVVTIHLTEKEYASFGKLLACSDDKYEEAADRLGVTTKRVYYVTGAVGAGKTSCVHKMKSLSWFGEWVDTKPENLAKPHTSLSKEERIEVDKWVSKQFRMKDFKIANLKKGLVISDRSPLDPLAFSPKTLLTKRASEHLKIISPNKKRRISNGQVIMLTASGEELLSRAKHRHKDANVDYYTEQQKTVESLYGRQCEGVTVISTSGRSINQVVRLLSKIIHLEPYKEFDIESKIEEISGGKNEV